MGRNHRDAAAAKSVLAEHEYECAHCGIRLGKHRYGTDQCPNANWRAGNGQSQWLTSTFAETATAAWQQQGDKV